MVSPATPAGTYTHGHHDSVLRSHRWRTAENSAAYLLPHLRAGLRLLDVGCGPGTITLDLARAVAPGEVVGIDAADAPLAEAHRHALDQDLGAVSFVQADVMALDFDDASFDVIHAHQVLQHLVDPVGALAEMRRLCRSDGVVAVRDADYAAMTWFPSDPRLDRWLELYQRLARANGGEPDAGRRLRTWALDAGFARVEASASVWCFAADDERAWWSGSWAERLRSSALGDQARACGAAEHELDDLAAGWLDWGRARGAWFAVVHGEVLARP